jgi:hypothetical protein
MPDLGWRVGVSYRGFGGTSIVANQRSDKRTIWKVCAVYIRMGDFGPHPFYDQEGASRFPSIQVHLSTSLIGKAVSARNLWRA